MSICLCNLSADIALELIAQKKIEINPASPDPSSFTADPTLVDRVLGTFCEKLPRPVELLVGNAKDRRYTPGTCCHVWRGRLPKNGVFALDEGIYVSSPEFTLLQQSNQLHQVNLCQMLGRYLGTWTPMKDQPSGQGERAPLTSFDSLHELSLDMRGARGMGNLKFAMAHTCDRAASPAETSLQLALSLPPELHGLNILQPSMNYQVDLSPKAQRLYPHESIRIDLCWRHKKFGLEFQGKEHGNRLGEDYARWFAARTEQYELWFVANEQIESAVQMRHIGYEVAKRIDWSVDERTWPTEAELQDLLDILAGRRHPKPVSHMEFCRRRAAIKAIKRTNG